AQHDRRVSVAAFDETVAALPVPPEPEGPTVPRLPEPLDRGKRDYWLSTTDMTEPMLAALWAHLAPAGCGLWWSSVGEATATGALISGGLPTTEAFVMFLEAGLEIGSDVAMERT